ncbi:MAG: hypothetical protein ACREFR_16790, partial [Limisphaerales bacterium]
LQRGVAIVGTFAAVASIAYAVSSVARFEDFISAGRFGGFGADQTGDTSSPLNVAKIAMVTLVAGWVWFRENRERRLWSGTALIVALASALPMFVLARSRTNMIGLGVLAMYAATATLLERRFGKRGPPKHFRLTRTKLALMSLALTLTIIGSAFIAKTIIPLINSALAFLGSGAASFFGDGHGVSGLSLDLSAADRLAYFNHALRTFSLWGHGFKSGFIDNPFFESFYDLGLIGGSIYAIITIILPIKISLDLIRGGQIPPYVKFAMAAYLSQVPRLFLSRTPYELNNWAFILLFYIVAGRFWSLDRVANRRTA